MIPVFDFKVNQGKEEKGVCWCPFFFVNNLISHQKSVLFENLPESSLFCPQLPSL